MNLIEKLLEIQKSVNEFAKTEENGSDHYKFVASDMVVNAIREKMNELNLLLIPEVTSAKVMEGQTRSGTARYFTEIESVMTWVNGDDPADRLPVKWYSQGVDLAGEKGVGKAQTYGEKYFFLKFFHIPTVKDDPDNDATTKGGEKKLTASAKKETADACRKWSAEMLNELCGGDAEKIKKSVNIFTKLRKVDGTESTPKDSLDDVSDKAAPVVYARIKASYKEKTGHDFIHSETEEQES